MTVVDNRPPCVLSIAGSDSGGGAGIQADLKAFAQCGAHGTTAITAITAQSTVGVDAVHPVPPDVVVAQVAAVARDIGVDAVKIGMLGTIETIEATERALDLLGPEAPVVLDPVMVAESGAALLDDDAVAALRERLVPRATVVTPNVMEARALAKRGEESGEAPAETAGREELEALARAVHRLGPGAVVVTGGHAGEPADFFFDGDGLRILAGERHAGGATHGSGCTHSAALAAQLALGHSALESARRAQAVASAAVRDGLRGVGAGAGPVNALGIGLDSRRTSSAFDRASPLT